MIPAGNKVKNLLSVNHTTKTIRHCYLHHEESYLLDGILNNDIPGLALEKP